MVHGRLLAREPVAEPDVRTRDRRARVALLAADVVAALAAVAVAGVPGWLAAAPLLVLLAKLHGLYDLSLIHI